MKPKYVIPAVTLLLIGLVFVPWSKYIPENYDGNEFMKLAELSAMAELSETCNKAELESIRYQSLVLTKYSQNTLKQNIADIYYGIYELAVELDKRENPSDAYCKIKRQSIVKLTNEALATFGGRKK